MNNEEVPERSEPAPASSLHLSFRLLIIPKTRLHNCNKNLLSRQPICYHSRLPQTTANNPPKPV